MKQSPDSSPFQIEVSQACCSPEPANASNCCADHTANTAASACCDSSSVDASNSLWRSSLKRLQSAWSLVLLIPLLVAAFDPAQFSSVLLAAISSLSGTAPYIVLAVLLLAWLKASQADALVAQAFIGRENRMIVMAALLGGLAPFCSCEVIPFIAGLLALGAPVTAVMAFWLSSPLIDPPSLMITAGALGWEFAVAKAVAAVCLGLFGGFGVKLLMRHSAFQNPLKATPASSCSSGACDTRIDSNTQAQWRFWQYSEQRQVFKATALENAVFLFKWLTLAYLLEALLIHYVPASLIGQVVGGEGLGAIIIGALVGMPAYLNSYAAPPLVAGLMQQGMSPGAAMAFMLAGAISSIPAMTAVWSLVKKPVFAAYLLLGVAGAVIGGVLFSLLMWF